MNDDYFTKLDEQLSALTSEGAHLDRWARWRPVDRAARRTVAALGLVVLLAALLVIEFPGSASGSVHRATARTALGSLDGGAHVASVGRGPTATPTAPLGRFA
jgi:hypothetical protein